MDMVFLKCVFGPALYRIFMSAKEGFRPYEPNALEYWTNCALDLSHYAVTLSKYFSPMIGLWVYNRGAVSMCEMLMHYAPPLTVMYVLLWAGRGVGRLNNEQYLRFIKMFHEAQRKDHDEGPLSNRSLLSHFDYDFAFHPVDYVWSDELHGEKIKPRYMATGVEEQTGREETGAKLTNFAKHFVCSMIAHTIGIRLLYPGMISLIQKNLLSTLNEGRINLLTTFSAKRLKLKTKNANYVDAVFVDRRNGSSFSNGNVLVVTCEGNAGFYEIGCPKPPLAAGYSVLGWNHPGFGGSSGLPWPKHEFESIDVVLQFALSQGFLEEQIVIYAWSIGGFVASWAGVNYPNIKAIILDAPFDDLLPLALKTLPESCSDLVEYTVRNFMNLHTAALIKDYNGRLGIIRRSKDEILSSPDDLLGANRCNSLINTVLSTRYPALFDKENDAIVDSWLRSDDGWSVRIDKMEVSQCREMLASYVQKHGTQFPMYVGKEEDTAVRRRLSFYLLQHMVTTFDALHCTELPAFLFRVPHHPWEQE